MYNEVMDSQISLTYWANRESVSIIQWPEFTYLSTRIFTVPSIPPNGPSP